MSINNMFLFRKLMYLFDKSYKIKKGGNKEELWHRNYFLMTF